jgi:hypothetical protein
MDGFPYDFFTVLESRANHPRRRLIRTRNQVVAWAVYRAAITEERIVDAMAYGFEGTCVWCQGMGDNSLEEDADHGYPSVCQACSGTGRTTHHIEAALTVTHYPGDGDTDYWAERYGDGSGTTNAETEGYRSTIDDPQAYWF